MEGGDPAPSDACDGLSKAQLEESASKLAVGQVGAWLVVPCSRSHEGLSLKRDEARSHEGS